MSERERAVTSAIGNAAGVALEALEGALTGLTTADGPGFIVGEAVNVTLSLIRLAQACEGAWITHDALAAVE
jgi:hypothetical protein